jgi:hypothetical protein
MSVCPSFHVHEPENRLKLAGIEVLTVVIMNSSILWGIMPCSGSTFTGLHGVTSQKREFFLFRDVLDM